MSSKYSSGEADGFSTLPDIHVSVSDFVDLLNETYEFAFPSVVICGELANLRVSKNKWLYFDLKDDGASLKFFGTVFQLPGPLENGMMLNVRGVPHMHELYGFSVNVQTIQAAGEGSIRRAAELLTAKLQAEGLFDVSRKRAIPYPPQRIGLVTSAQSAAYADFIKILADRWSGIDIRLVDVQVQGEIAAGQVVAAIERFNTVPKPPEVLVLIRGGGSADDLATFSSEQVTRAVAASRIPTLVAIGHEIDVSLAELAADKRASTPSNAAELLVPDKQVVLESIAETSEALYDAVQDILHGGYDRNTQFATTIELAIQQTLEQQRRRYTQSRQLLEALSPQAALKRGYAVLRSDSGELIHSNHLPQRGDRLDVELFRVRIQADVISVQTLTPQKQTTVAQLSEQ